VPVTTNEWDVADVDAVYGIVCPLVVPATSAVFVDSLPIVGAPAEPTTVVIAADPVTEVDSKPDPVAVNVAVPVALLRATKKATPSLKSALVNAVVIAVELFALKKLTVEVAEARVTVSPVPRAPIVTGTE
jgi:hypothetical protein